MALTKVQSGLLDGGSGLNLSDSAPANTLVTTSAGNVGIGTASPSQPLTVQANSSGDALTLRGRAAGENAQWLAFANNAGTVQAAMYATSNNFIFATSSDYTERMRISSSGTVGIAQNADYYGKFALTFDATNAANNNLGIGVSPLANTSNAIYMMFYNATGNACGTISRNGTSNAVLYNTSSDYRLKENIAPVTGALAKVQALKPVTWTWKDCDGQTGEGFIAHEVQEVVPSAVSGEKDAVDAKGNPVYQGMDASYLVATLTAAIQEQQAIITDLKARIETLEAK
jgi:hypothetical protein